MESSPIFRLSSPPFLTPNSKNTKHSFSRPWKHTTSKSTQVKCNKMFVPGFGEASPEAKAATNLNQFFTYIAVKIVTAQLESYNPEAHKDLMEFLETHSLNDGDKFCADLMRESPMHKSLVTNRSILDLLMKQHFEFWRFDLLTARKTLSGAT